MRNNAILQTTGTTLAGLPTEASIWNAVEAAIPGFYKMSTPTPRVAVSSSGSCR